MNMNEIRKILIKITILLVLLMCSQYICMGVYIGKDITGLVNKRYVRNLCHNYRWTK